MAILDDKEKEFRSWRQQKVADDNKKRQPGMKTITCHYTDRDKAAMDKLVELGYYPNRSELMRDAWRSLERREFADITREL